ncbi:TetR/AcrR family transcriptional regulator [Clostridium sp. D2Q-14]|uniref:TetR/AcrR family transcriptional regulator n=1 Tax=Anaeromonas gelatinilytica TaxID=2683194 RepID=UPI00193BB8C0|nr:TetR/AcrR family transcriptional regulator [Anaeromonas gelatinilytica]MBS4534118.1 TetR/AcrR family transcriptional regulator [Anaeromonas gelatinilytica]
MSSAFELFSTKGINETSISNIVHKAGVAKGTFYLYFKDKYDILNKIILNKSSHLLIESMNATKSKNFASYEEAILYFINYIIEYFNKNKLMLKLIYKNLSWGVIKRASNEYEGIHEIYDFFMNLYKDSDISEQDIEKTLFIIIDLVGSVCYSSIILNEPDTIDKMKPILFDTIKKII